MLSAKRFIPISESVLAVAAKLAERSGIPLRDFIESVLAEVLKAMQFRSNVIEVISLSDLLDDLRRVGGVVVPKDFIYKFLESMDDELFSELIDEVRKIASWYGTLVKVKRGPDVETLRLVLNVWLPDMNVSIVRSGSSVRLIASASKQPMRATELAGVIVEELCKSLDLKVKDLIIEKGIIKVEIEGPAGEVSGE
ncbi:MAG: hypothetical protein J7J20_02560 [Desulfurococcales archaeon]|nr:hypothetical protein [Desulfurococcales archaeon]